MAPPITVLGGLLAAIARLLRCHVHVMFGDVENSRACRRTSSPAVVAGQDATGLVNGQQRAGCLPLAPLSAMARRPRRGNARNVARGDGKSCSAAAAIASAANDAEMA